KLEDAGALADSDAVLQTEGTHLADQARSVPHHLLANAMQGLDIDLFRGLHLDEPHRRSCDGFGNSSGIDHVVLVRLHVGLDELGRNNANRVPHGLQLPRQPLCTGTRLHAYECRSCSLEEGQHSLTSELCALDDLPRRVCPNDMEDVLANIDTI